MCNKYQTRVTAVHCYTTIHLVHKSEKKNNPEPALCILSVHVIEYWLNMNLFLIKFANQYICINRKLQTASQVSICKVHCNLQELGLILFSKQLLIYTISKLYWSIWTLKYSHLCFWLRWLRVTHLKLIYKQKVGLLTSLGDAVLLFIILAWCTHNLKQTPARFLWQTMIDKYLPHTQLPSSSSLSEKLLLLC